MLSRTKCDLSFNKALLDFDALLSTAKIAVGHCVERIEEHKQKIHDANLHGNGSSLSHQAGHLLRQAENLATSSEVLATLMAAQSREHLAITGHELKE